jgi:hypothetical protein
MGAWGRARTGGLEPRVGMGTVLKYFESFHICFSYFLWLTLVGRLMFSCVTFTSAYSIKAHCVVNNPS